MKYYKGDILFIDLDPAKGNEMKKTRPCLVVSNDNYNDYFNTIIVAPISSSLKYQQIEKYKVSPFFVQIDCKEIHGTVLLQHVRSVDTSKRNVSHVVARLDDNKTMKKIEFYLKKFFD